MESRHTRPPFKELKPELVIAFDIGTTFSTASYSILTPNEVPRIVDVTGYRGQEHKASSMQVPSVLVYDSGGRLRACGSEVDDEILTDEDCFKVEWFKLLLRPPLLADAAPSVRLPPNKTAVDVFGDFLRYMRGCVREYVLETHVDGENLWRKLRAEAHFVVTHPNGWEGYQQAQLRDAAILGGLVPDKPSSRDRIVFMTEGEAIFHCCVDVGLAQSSDFQPNTRAIVINAGAGTIDVSSFRVTSLQPLRLLEAAPAECRLAGSVFVTQEFKRSLEDHLHSSHFGCDDYIERAVEEFDKRIMPQFRDRSKDVLIRIGSRKDIDRQHAIRMGQLSLTGDFIAATFDNSCANATEAIRLHLNRLGGPTMAFLVGSFGANPWLYSELQRRLATDQVEIRRPDHYLPNVIARGAVVGYLEDSLYAKSPASDWTFGPSNLD